VNDFLLDTNIPSELTYPKPQPLVERWLDQVDNGALFFSVISLAEICKGIAKLPPSKKTNGTSAVARFHSSPLVFRAHPACYRSDCRANGPLGRGKKEAQGRTIKIADGLIAATAVEHGLVVVTRNVKDFAGFGVEVLNPWDAS
jgi:predicted nucleic acid-binding protein